MHSRLPLFPITTTIQLVNSVPILHIAGCDLKALADQYGTPLYLYDQATLDESVNDYRQSLAASYPGETGITYAGKAFLCLAIAQWVKQQGLILDCTGAGELYIASMAGMSQQNLLVHGVNKSQADLSTALEQAGILVVDNLTELNRLIALHPESGTPFPEIWLRVRPGFAVNTPHAYTQTGQNDSKFGMSLEETRQAIELCTQQNLPLTGLHFHLGSHFHDPAPIGPAMDAVLDVAAKLAAITGWTPKVLSPGGGWGVPYHEDDLPHPSAQDYVKFVSRCLEEGCKQRGLPLPRLQLEPGRSLVARAGVAIYRVGAVKYTPNRRWLLLDGGLADNPRPALYRARYSALPICEPDRPAVGPAWLGGPFCESGDVMIESLPLPEMQPGDLIAVPVSGAYQLSMGSNYNGARKPAVIWLKNGQSRLIQRREILADLLRRDQGLEE